MRLMRPWGHLGLIFTWGLPWSLVAVAMHRRSAWRLAYLGGYALLPRGDHVDDRRVGDEAKRPLEENAADSAVGRDGVRIWLVSFGRRTIRWRGVDYFIRAREARAGAATPCSAVRRWYSRA